MWYIFIHGGFPIAILVYQRVNPRSDADSDESQKNLSLSNKKSDQ